MNHKKLGVAIIGCGIISSSHVKAYQAFSDKCEIKAVCDVFPNKAITLAESIDKDVLVFTDFKDLLKREDIDVVSICTPPFAHKEAVIEAFKAGKHVICEKPLAASLEECDEMIAAAEKYLFSDEVKKAYETDPQFDAPIVPQPAFTDAEQETIAIKGEAVTKRRDEEVAKFILGERSFDEWESFVEEMKNLGVEDMVKIYSDAHQRMLEVDLNK